MNQKRQPKGTENGGQFAPDVNPECTLILDDGVTNESVLDPLPFVEIECSQCGDVSTFSNAEAAESAGWRVDAAAVCAHCVRILRSRTTPTPLQVAQLEIATLRKDREENPSLDEIILRRSVDRLSESDDLDYDESVANDPSALANEYKRYSQGMHDRDYDGAFEGIDYVVERFIDWREVSKEDHSVEHEAPFQIGSVLEYDVEVVPWVPGMHEENVAVQVWMKAWGDADNDCAGWEPRAIAQIARERGMANVTNRDLQDILDDPDIDKIAIRPDTSITRLIKQINDCNSESATS